MTDGKFEEDEARFWFHQILNAVETLQNAGICHRDMSLENIMTTGDGLAIVIDFGMCLKIPYETDEHGIRQRCYMKRDRVCGKVSSIFSKLRKKFLVYRLLSSHLAFLTLSILAILHFTRNL